MTRFTDWRRTLGLLAALALTSPPVSSQPGSRAGTGSDAPRLRHVDGEAFPVEPGVYSIPGIDAGISFGSLVRGGVELEWNTWFGLWRASSE